MSIIELGALGEFLGSIGVIATLIYLAIQIRQNTHSLGEGRKLAMAQAYQARAEGRIRMQDTIIASDDVSDAVLKVQGANAPPEAYDELTPILRLRYRAYVIKTMLSMDSQYYYYQNGFLDQESYESNLVTGVRRWGPVWKNLGVQFRNSFREEVDRILAESEENEQ